MQIALIIIRRIIQLFSIPFPASHFYHVDAVQHQRQLGAVNSRRTVFRYRRRTVRAAFQPFGVQRDAVGIPRQYLYDGAPFIEKYEILIHRRILSDHPPGQRGQTVKRFTHVRRIIPEI